MIKQLGVLLVGSLISLSSHAIVAGYSTSASFDITVDQTGAPNEFFIVDYLSLDTVEDFTASGTGAGGVFVLPPPDGGKSLGAPSFWTASADGAVDAPAGTVESNAVIRGFLDLFNNSNDDALVTLDYNWSVSLLTIFNGAAPDDGVEGTAFVRLLGPGGTIVNEALTQSDSVLDDSSDGGGNVEFTLGAGQFVTFSVDLVASGSAFTRDSGGQVPVPAVPALLGIGLLAMLRARRVA